MIESKIGEQAGTEEQGASQQQPELSVRVVILGAILSAVLAGANAYLGLFAGMTVSASIPAAVISMGLLRAVGGSLLENNLVQTAASAGESAAAGALFTLPALIMLGAWAKFDLILTASLTLLGGVLGVLFTIVLRRALVVESDLVFPEGRATAAVLRAGHGESEGASSAETSGSETSASSGLRLLVQGALFGSLAKLVQSGFALSKASVEGAVAARWGIFHFGVGVSPALAAVGYIVGLNVAVVVFIGGALNWFLILPFVAEPQEGVSALDIVWETWSTKTRYLGVGAMTLGGFSALYEVRKSIFQAVRAAFLALSPQSTNLPETVELSERDLPTKGVLLASLLCLLPLFAIFHYLTGETAISALLAVLVLVFGFLFSAVAAYMAGLVGSSNNPVSGVTIATILFTSLLLSFLGVSAVAPGFTVAAGPAAAILVGSVVCTAAAIGGDNMQDLKAGHLLGATPYRQQIMQLVGVVAAALVLGPVFQLLLDAYGFGAPTVEHPHALRAPQATLMASVADGVFGGSLPWDFFFYGVGLGAVVITIDAILKVKKTDFRMPVLAVALGLYLPWEISIPVLLGGVVARVSQRAPGRQERAAPLGLLMGAGLITGEALMGILLAAGVAFGGGSDWLVLGTRVESSSLSIILLLSALALLFFSEKRKKTDDS